MKLVLRIFFILSVPLISFRANAQTYTLASPHVVESVENNGLRVSRLTRLIKDAILGFDSESSKSSDDGNADSESDERFSELSLLRVKILITRAGEVRLVISHVNRGIMRVYRLLNPRTGFEAVENRERARAFDDVWLESDFERAEEVLLDPYAIELRGEQEMEATLAVDAEEVMQETEMIEAVDAMEVQVRPAAPHLVTLPAPPQPLPSFGHFFAQPLGFVQPQAQTPMPHQPVTFQPGYFPQVFVPGVFTAYFQTPPGQFPQPPAMMAMRLPFDSGGFGWSMGPH